ncbi:MAG: glycoside hydrolase family 127 protein [Opitutae bacterium]|nr:glycoside hydrolase family 127 protein [Opitutae bacterium]
MKPRLPLCWLILAIAPFVGGQTAAVKPPVADALRFAPAAEVSLQGFVGTRIDQCLQQRVAEQTIDDLVQPFRERRDKTEWRSEFWGKWITSAIEAHRWNHDPKLRAHLARAVSELLATQTPDGYLGAYSPENRLQCWDVWGRKYTLHGLLAWHEMTGDAAALQAACRLADHLLTEVGPGKGNPFRNDMWSGLATSSVIEPMVLLYRRTGETKYLDFARWIVREWTQPHGPDLLGKTLRGQSVFQMFPGPDPTQKGYMAGGRSKAYEMMSCFEGLLELHRVTGVDDYRQAAEKVFANIRDTEITIIGSGSDWERWCDGRRRQTVPWLKGMETCVTVTWIKFAGQLLRLTGDSAYADEIELATYNALLGALSPDGSWWSHHVPLDGKKERAPEQCDMHQNCCVASGPRGLMLLPSLALMDGARGPVVNYYGPMRGRATLPSGQTVELAQATDYPVSGEVRLRVSPERAETFPLQLRIPRWSQHTTVTVNGTAQPGVTAGRYFTLERKWSPGDTVVLTFDVSPRVVPAPGDARFAAIMCGPVVLAHDRQLAGKVGEKASELPALAEKVAVRASAEKPPAGFWLAFDADFGAGATVRLCDFASAGNYWEKGPGYTVWFSRR